ncbi:MAG: hypothetical protein JRH13_13390 [Deltaproteobacteria bacterium]|nr:hypothetical protein [Deltaproteobacteria bacterium]
MITGQVPLEDEFRGAGALRSVMGRLLHSMARLFPMHPKWRVWIHRWRGVKIGDGVFIGSEVFIDNTYPESIEIQDYAAIASGSMIIGHFIMPVHFRKVLGVIGAGSVVTQEIPDYSVAAGVPARVLRSFSKEKIEFMDERPLENAQFWSS